MGRWAGRPSTEAVRLPAGSRSHASSLHPTARDHRSQALVARRPRAGRDGLPDPGHDPSRFRPSGLPRWIAECDLDRGADGYSLRPPDRHAERRTDCYADVSTDGDTEPAAQRHAQSAAQLHAERTAQLYPQFAAQRFAVSASERFTEYAAERFTERLPEFVAE